MFVLLRPVGFRCNCACDYCYYKDGHNQMRNHDNDGVMPIAFVEKLLSDLESLDNGHHTICLHGGEPLLAGKEWINNFIELINNYNIKHNDAISLAMQTNALLIDNEWIELFKKGKIGISVSLDGPAKVHDHARKSLTGNGTFDTLIKNISLLKSEGFNPSAISVMTNNTFNIRPEDYYNFFIDIGITEIDITPYIETGDSSIQEAARQAHEADSSRLYDFMSKLFDVWFIDGKKRLNIRTFEQTVLALLGYIPSLCNRKTGNACGRTPCIMPDGSVFACDLETDRIDLLLGTLSKERFADIVHTDRLQRLHSHIGEAFEQKGCTACTLHGYCGFSCPRFAFSDRRYDSYCEFSKRFIDYVKGQIDGLSEELYKERISFAI